MCLFCTLLPFAVEQPECLVDEDCPLHEACDRVSQTCGDPCRSQTCGTNAECQVNTHRPTCTCRPQYEGNPYKACHLRKRITKGPSLQRPSLQTSPMPSFFFPLPPPPPAGCKSDYECRDNEACINRDCQNPCLYEECGVNAFCETVGHHPRCRCHENHIPDPDPYTRCRPYECLRNEDCVDTLACVDEKCEDPCDCADNADCTRRNHRGICNCRPGYTGDAYVRGCTKSKQGGGIINTRN